jgi:hypothetical protein
MTRGSATSSPRDERPHGYPHESNSVGNSSRSSRWRKPRFCRGRCGRSEAMGRYAISNRWRTGEVVSVGNTRPGSRFVPGSLAAASPRVSQCRQASRRKRSLPRCEATLCCLEWCPWLPTGGIVRHNTPRERGLLSTAPCRVGCHQRHVQQLCDGLWLSPDGPVRGTLQVRMWRNCVHCTPPPIRRASGPAHAATSTDTANDHCAMLVFRDRVMRARDRLLHSGEVEWQSPKPALLIPEAQVVVGDVQRILHALRSEAPPEAVRVGGLMILQARRCETWSLRARCATASRLRAGLTTFPPSAP